MTDVPIRVTLARHYAEMYFGGYAHLAEPMAAQAEALYLAASEDLDRENQRLRAQLAARDAELTLRYAELVAARGHYDPMGSTCKTTWTIAPVDGRTFTRCILNPGHLGHHTDVEPESEPIP